MNKICLLSLISIFLFYQENLKGQVDISGNNKQPLVGGYLKNLEGEILPYFSSYQQFAKEALLTRCTDGTKWIRWQSADVPSGFHDDYCYFYFLAGHSTGTSKE